MKKKTQKNINQQDLFLDNKFTTNKTFKPVNSTKINRDTQSFYQDELKITDSKKVLSTFKTKQTLKVKKKYTDQKIQTLNQYIKYKLIKLCGIILCVLACMLLISLLTYNQDDPSFNTAIDSNISNFCGAIGSYFSDLLFQLLGCAAYTLPLAIASRGVFLFKYETFTVYRYIICILMLITSSLMYDFVQIHNYIPSGVLYINLSKMLKNLFDFDGFNKYWYLCYCSCLFSLLTYSIFIVCGVTPEHFSYIKKFLILLFNICKSIIQYMKNLIYKIYNLVNHDTIHEMPITNQNIEPVKAQKNVLKPLKVPQQMKLNDGYMFPSTTLLKIGNQVIEKIPEEVLKANGETLIRILNDFSIDCELTLISPGPVVTLYEIRPAAGIKSSRIIALSSDIALYMSAISTRVAVVQGKNTIGIEVPNKHRQTVYLRELLEANEYTKSSLALPIILGHNIAGEPIIVDLAKMPHLLIAGTTGSGKSVGINAMILSLLYKLTPKQCRLIMIDPKMLELSVYNDIPHLLTPVVTDPKEAVIALKWAVKEMENRYKAMSKLGIRNIDGYNAKVSDLKNREEILTKKIQTGFDPETNLPMYESQVVTYDYLPYIVIVVDEMADLMLVAGKDIEQAVQRLAQMARAAGIHLIMATQRPSVDVITGTIKANFPTRISFQVSSKIDSRTILGDQGAEQLLGSGDMLYMSSGGKCQRIHGPFCSDSEVESVVSSLKQNGEPEYILQILQDDGSDSLGSFTDDEDELYKQAVNIVLNDQKTSISYLQRKLRIGYNKSATLIEKMEEKGVLSSPSINGKREILI